LKSFEWNRNFETGLETVDQQHQHLLELVNQFGTRLMDNSIDPSALETLFAELAAYAQRHFEEEELLMVEVEVDPRHRAHHAAAHRGFLKEVSIMHAAVSLDSPKTIERLLDFLIHWLVYHILGADQSMARQIAAIGSGLTAAQAYDAEEQNRDDAKEPLINALNHLFHLGSERNRELARLNQSLETKVAERTRELSAANARLHEIAMTDVLTALPNRRHAMQHLKDLWQKSMTAQTDMVCIMLDADHFKEVNDMHGHEAGDDVLCEIAKTLRHEFRSDDLVSRLGGDEFCVICPDTDLGGGMRIAELARNRIAQLRVPFEDGVWNGSMSVGVASRTPEINSIEDLMRAADAGVYAAKKGGKNCVRSTQFPAESQPNPLQSSVRI